MKAEKIRGLESAELQKQLADMGETMFRLRFQMSLGHAD
jgi:ribosomal protein L29